LLRRQRGSTDNRPCERAIPILIPSRSGPSTPRPFSKSSAPFRRCRACTVKIWIISPIFPGCPKEIASQLGMQGFELVTGAPPDCFRRTTSQSGLARIPVTSPTVEREWASVERLAVQRRSRRRGAPSMLHQSLCGGFVRCNGLFGGRLSHSLSFPACFYDTEEQPQQRSGYPDARDEPTSATTVGAHTHCIGEENP